jgi:hypothetical protein
MNSLAACEFGPLATRRKRVAFACRCAACVFGISTDKRLLKLLEVSRDYIGRTASFADIDVALRAADLALAEAEEQALTEVWSIFEGRRAGESAALARAVRTTTRAIRWALGIGGAPPPIPESWIWAKKSFTDSATAPVCEAAWRTPDVLALAQLIQSGGTDAIPILADALQDAGCEDKRILDHCRDTCVHSAACWVPDLILDNK